MTITQQVEQAVELPEPKRAEEFKKILATITDKKVKENVSLIYQRIRQASLPVRGFTKSEVEYFQSCFAKEFYFILHSEKFAECIEDRANGLRYFCEAQELELRVCDNDRREILIAQCLEADRYKIFLQSILPRFEVPTGNKVKRKLTNPVIALFCQLANYSDRIIRKDGERAKDYCQRVCKEYSLPYKDGVRARLNHQAKLKYLNSVILEILPNVDTETKTKIEQYIDKNYRKK